MKKNDKVNLNRKNEIAKFRAEINEIESSHTIVKTCKTKH